MTATMAHFVNYKASHQSNSIVRARVLIIRDERRISFLIAPVRGEYCVLRHWCYNDMTSGFYQVTELVGNIIGALWKQREKLQTMLSSHLMSNHSSINALWHSRLTNPSKSWSNFVPSYYQIIFNLRTWNWINLVLLESVGHFPLSNPASTNFVVNLGSQ